MLLNTLYDVNVTSCVCSSESLLSYACMLSEHMTFANFSNFWFILMFWLRQGLIFNRLASCTHVLYEIPIIYVLCSSSMPQGMEFIDAFFRYMMLQQVQKFSHYTMKPKLTIIYVIRRHLTAMMIWCSTMVCSGMCSLARYERTTLGNSDVTELRFSLFFKVVIAGCRYWFQITHFFLGVMGT